MAGDMRKGERERCLLRPGRRRRDTREDAVARGRKESCEGERVATDEGKWRRHVWQGRGWRGEEEGGRGGVPGCVRRTGLGG